MTVFLCHPVKTEIAGKYPENRKKNNSLLNQKNNKNQNMRTGFYI